MVKYIARKEGERLRMTSEDFASKMIEGFEPHEKPSVDNPAEKMEKKINEAMKEEVKKVIPEEKEEPKEEPEETEETEESEESEEKEN